MTPMRLGLRAALLVPVLYFGAQLVGVLFYPGYDPLSQVASQLGSPQSTRPEIFNGLVMATGAATVLGGWGLTRALPADGCPRPLAWLVGAAMLGSGAASLWAGWYPLPDPRHNPGPLMIAILLLPLLLPAAFWRARGRGAGPLKAYLLLNLIGLALAAPVNSGAIPFDRAMFGGLLQRLTALFVYLPIAVAAWRLLVVSPSRGDGRPRSA